MKQSEKIKEILKGIIKGDSPKEMIDAVANIGAELNSIDDDYKKLSDQNVEITEKYRDAVLGQTFGKQSSDNDDTPKGVPSFEDFAETFINKGDNK